MAMHILQMVKQTPLLSMKGTPYWMAPEVCLLTKIPNKQYVALINTEVTNGGNTTKIHMLNELDILRKM